MRIGYLTGVVTLALGAVFVPTAANAASSAGVKLRAFSYKADTINCELKVQYPHRSTHVPRTVNVVAILKCDRAMSGLKIKVRLYKNGHVYKTSGWKANNVRASIQGNAGRRCVKKSHYQGEAWAYAWPPAGYTPPMAYFHAKGVNVYLKSCT
jgi:hypothetical protein